MRAFTFALLLVPGTPLGFSRGKGQETVSCFWHGEGKSNHFEIYPEARLTEGYPASERTLPKPSAC